LSQCHLTNLYQWVSADLSVVDVRGTDMQYILHQGFQLMGVVLHPTPPHHTLPSAVSEATHKQT